MNFLPQITQIYADDVLFEKICVNLRDLRALFQIESAVGGKY